MRLLCVDASRNKGSEYFEKWIEEGVPANVKKIVFAITGNRFEPFEAGYKN